MSSDTDQLSIDADPSEGISIEKWDEIMRQLDQITIALTSLHGRLNRLHELLPDSSG
jgi:hypothetical protein